MNTTTITPATPTYRAVCDGGKWHLGSVERGPLTFCSTTLMTPGDTRKFALKVPEAKRNFQAVKDLERVNCGTCRKNREWSYAHGTPRPAPAVPGQRRSRRAPSAGDAVPRVAGARPADADRLAADIRRRRPQHAATIDHTEAADLAAGAAAANGDHAERPSRRRGSAADRRNAQQQADRERREALAANADAVVDAITAAVAEATGEAPITATPAAPATARPLSRAAKARALVDSGECATLAAARRYLADMGE
jgi:hypothetical protein